jgi:hypothetical protein
VLKAFGHDAECQRLHLGESRPFAFAIGRDSRKFQDFGQSSAIVFAFRLNLEGDHPQPSKLNCTTDRCSQEIQLTRR